MRHVSRLLVSALGVLLCHAVVPVAAAKSKTTLPAFIQKLQSEGTDNFIRPNVAPLLGLPPNAPSKAYVVDELPRVKGNQPEKIFNLVYEVATATTPVSIVIIAGDTTDATSLGRYFKVGLDGKLSAAITISGKRQDGKAVRGSGVKEDLDLTSPAVQAAFKKELDYWLSGRFRRHWKPKPKPQAPASP